MTTRGLPLHDPREMKRIVSVCVAQGVASYRGLDPAKTELGRYTPEFKAKTMAEVQRLRREGKSLAKIAAEIGVNLGTIRLWYYPKPHNKTKKP